MLFMKFEPLKRVKRNILLDTDIESIMYGHELPPIFDQIRM